jgi:hypothetical protein
LDAGIRSKTVKRGVAMRCIAEAETDSKQVSRWHIRKKKGKREAWVGRTYMLPSE